MKNSIWVLAVVIVVVILFIIFGRGGAPEPTSEQPTGQTEMALYETEIAELKAIAPFSGDGQATRLITAEEFSHIVIANLADPPPGKFYEGWLVDKDPNLRFFSTGRLNIEQDRYTLTYVVGSGEREFSEFNSVIITQETEANGLDGVPEDHVLEGSF